ncbi:hypothetical protein A2U01_0089854, partial [Trifolium medium]|nr:hypothetical protein [Trifolium medium]
MAAEPYPLVFPAWIADVFPSDVPLGFERPHRRRRRRGRFRDRLLDRRHCLPVVVLQRYSSARGRGRTR